MSKAATVPIPMSIRTPDPRLTPGDIVEIEGLYNRPGINTLAWWAMLLFGAPFTYRHLPWALRGNAEWRGFPVPKGRRALLSQRVLQRFVISGPHTEPEGQC